MVEAFSSGVGLGGHASFARWLQLLDKDDSLAAGDMYSATIDREYAACRDFFGFVEIARTAAKEFEAIVGAHTGCPGPGVHAADVGGHC